MNYREFELLKDQTINEELSTLKCPHCHRSLVSETVRDFAAKIWSAQERLFWPIYQSAVKYLKAGSDWQESTVTLASLRRDVSKLGGDE